MYLQRIVKDVAVMVFSYTMLRLDFFFESVIVSADGRADSVLLSVVAVWIVQTQFYLQRVVKDAVVVCYKMLMLDFFF